MVHPREQRSYEFDVAISYASEDRAYVQGFANALQQAGVTVFYDEFMQVELWGHDLYVYLDDVYRNRARYAIVFVSENYARKSWTAHERQSTQARALNELGPYLLPVRIDDTDLPGLRPTIAFMDARSTTPAQLVELVLRKLGSVAGAKDLAEEANKVRAVGLSSASDARRQLISERPAGWEWVLWGSVMWEGKERLEEKWRDHELKFAKRSTIRIETQQLRDFFHRIFDDLYRLVGKLNLTLGIEAQEWALGRPGEPGDPIKIDHLGRRFASIYEELLDWSSEIRGASVPIEAVQLTETAAKLVDLPLTAIRDFIDGLIGDLSDLPRRIELGEKVDISRTLKVDLDEDLIDRLIRELARLIETPPGAS